MPLQPLEHGQRPVQPLDQRGGREVPEVVGRQAGEQGHRDVGRRGAAGQLRLGPGLLVVVRREPGGLLGHERLEVPPGRSSRAPQQGAFSVDQGPLAGADGQAQPVGRGGRQEPQEQERRGRGQRVRLRQRNQGRDPSGDDGARHHLDDEVSQALPTHQPGGSRGGRGGRFPFEQPAPGDRQAHQRQHDRVRGRPRVVGQERQAERHLRERRGGVLPQVAPEYRERLRLPRPDQQPPHQRQQLRGDDHQGRRHPEPVRAGQRRPARHQHRQEHGRGEAPPQVVQNLPAADERQRVALDAVARRDEGKEPEENLPVAANPAMLPPRVRQDAGGILVHELHVGDQGHPRMEPLEQVVRQQRVLRHAVVERGHEGVHVVEALAGEDPFGEQVLVGVGDGRGVGIDAGMARVQAGEQRPGRAGECHAHAGLQDAVAVGDPAEPRVERGAVQWMGNDADQLPRDVARQPRVAVERDAVPDGRQDRHVADVDDEAGVGGAAQQAVELLDLAPLALPPHPEPFLLVPLPRPMAQEETVGPSAGMLRVERFDPAPGGGQDLLVARQRLGGRVADVAEDREVDARVHVAEGLHLEVRDQLAGALHAVEDRRDDHHGAGVLRHGAQLEPRQPARRNQVGDDPLHDLNRQLAGRDHQHERGPQQRPATTTVPGGIRQRRRDEHGGAQADRAQVARRRVPETQATHLQAQARAPADALLELPPPAADQVVADVSAPLRRRPLRDLPRPLDGLEGHSELGLARPDRPSLRPHGGTGRGSGSPSGRTR